MKKLIVVLLIAAAGCATPRAPEPGPSAIAREPETVRVEPAPVPPPAPAEKPAPIITQPASPAAEPAPVSQPPVAEKEEPKQHPSASRKPDEQAPPVVASKQPETPVTEEAKWPSSALREKPVSNHRLQSLTELADANDDKIMNVFVGMYRKTVETIMGQSRNPYRKTKITGTDGDYDVLFYLTREPRQGKPITDRMLYPVIFKRGRVIAMGNYQLKKLILNGTLERRKAVLSGK